MMTDKKQEMIDWICPECKDITQEKSWVKLSGVLCKKCGEGILELKDKPEYHHNKCAAYTPSTAHEKNVQWLKDRTEKQQAIGRKLGLYSGKGVQQL